MIKLWYSIKGFLLKYRGTIIGVILSFLVSLFIVYTVLPLIVRTNDYKSFVSSIETNFLIGATSLFIFVLLVTWKGARDLWKKYRNTFDVLESKFTNLDAIFCVGYFVVLIYVLQPYVPMPWVYKLTVFFGVLLCFSLIYFFISYYWKPKSVQEKFLSSGNEDEIADEPIRFVDQDVLNRGFFIQNLLNEIKSLNLNSAFVFGLYGKWGEGKSSVINILNKKLATAGDFIVVNFEPWYFKDEEAILRAFFKTIELSLNKDYIFPKLKNVFDKYQKIILSGLNSVGFNFNYLSQEETIDQLKSRIEDYISTTKKKMVVIVDEIDRLEADEIRLILKLIRSNSRFKNTIFLLSMDNTRVNKILGDSAGLLNKVVQKPINLPKIEHVLIDNYLLFSPHGIPINKVGKLDKDLIGKIVSVSGVMEESSDGYFVISQLIDQSERAADKVKVMYGERRENRYLEGTKLFVKGTWTGKYISLSDPDSFVTEYRLSKLDIFFEKLLAAGDLEQNQLEFFDKEFVSLYRSKLTDLFRNLRDTKRFLNGLYSSLPPIVGEVNLFDFVVLEIMRIMRPEIYEDIFDNWWIYVSARHEDDFLARNFDWGFTRRDKNEKLKIIREHINALYQRINLSKEEIDVWDQVLEKLFPATRRDHSFSGEDRQLRRIFTTSFYRYFIAKIPTYELSDQYFRTEIRKWNKERSLISIKSTFAGAKEQNKLVEFLDKLRIVYLDDLTNNSRSLLIKVICNLSLTFSRKDKGYFDSEYDRALVLLLRIFNSYTKKEDIQAEIEKVIKSTKDILFAVDLVLTTKGERKGDLFTIYDNTDSMKFRKVLAKRLYKRYLKDKRDVTLDIKDGVGWIRILYQWGSNWGDSKSPNRNDVTRYITEVLGKDYKRFINLIKSFGEVSFKGQWSINIAEQAMAYDLEALSVFAKEILATHKLVGDDNDVLSSFIKSVYKSKEVKASKE